MLPGPAQFMEESAIPAHITPQSKKKLSLDFFNVGRPFMETDELVSFLETFNS
jgi:hypothetical protein